MITQLKIALQQQLPGIQAHQKLAPNFRNTQLPDAQVIAQAKKAATLLLLYYKNNALHFALIERVSYEGVHSGQIAFPGGQKDKTDADFEVTALRETEEEIGVAQGDIEILGKLTNIYIPPSNYYVHPYIGFYGKPQLQFTPQATEVAQIIEIPVQSLLQEDIIRQVEIQTRQGFKVQVPAFVLPQCTVWGATALVLNEFIEIVQKRL